MCNKPSHSFFLSEIAKNIADYDAYLIYADWLQQKGDPRGEFIPLCYHAGLQDDPAITKAREQHLANWSRELLGELYAPFMQGQIKVNWRLGFLDNVKIMPGPSAQAILNQLSTNPYCRFLRYLDISHTDIVTLPDNFTKLVQIRKLDMRSCSLDSINGSPSLDQLIWVRVSECHRFNEPDFENAPIWIRAACYQAAVENTTNDQLQHISNDLDLDEEYYLSDSRDWSPIVCAALASKDSDFKLHYHHWVVIGFLRKYYEEYQIAPAARVLAKTIAKQLSNKKWGTSKFLYQLFPNGPGKQAPRYAGLPETRGYYQLPRL